MWKKLIEDVICVFLFIHFTVLPQITAKNRNGLNFQIMKVLMQIRIQLTLQSYATITPVSLFSEKNIKI